MLPADVGRKAVSQVKDAARQLLTGRIAEAQADALAEKMSTVPGRTIITWTHDYPITTAIAKELGLPISEDMPKEIVELMQLYPQPVRSQSSGGVEYLPVRRQKEAPTRRWSF